MQRKSGTPPEKKQPQTEVSELLKEIRRVHRYPDDVLGPLIGVSQQTVSLWRKGNDQKFDFRQLNKIQDVLAGKIKPAPAFKPLKELVIENIAEAELLEALLLTARKLIEERKKQQRTYLNELLGQKTATDEPRTKRGPQE